MERYQFTQAELNCLEQLPTPLAVYQCVERHVYTLALSDGFREMFGYEDKAEAYRLMNQDPCYNTHPDDVARIEEAIRRFIAEGGKYEVIFRGKEYRGQDYRIVHAIGRHVYKNGTRLAYVAFTDESTYTEGSDTRASALSQAFNSALHEESILKASYYDSLTGLPSMTYFFEMAEAEKAAITEKGEKAALVYLDLNGMKRYNSSYGFAEGDKLLRGFARLLGQAFGKEYCCHIGADRFAVFTPERDIEEKLSRVFRDATDVNGGKSLLVRVGVYFSTIEEVPESSAYDRAKMACDTIPKSDISSFCLYSNEMREEVNKRQYILSHIDQAISERWIHVYLQPIIRAVNGQVCDVEALARWIDPAKGFLSPADFISALEDAGLIYKLDLYMVDRVVETIQRQKAEGFNIIPHSINLSRSDFDACDIVEEIRKRVDEAGIRRDRLTIEITESVIGSDFEFMKEQVERFRSLGFPVWMDDFGSGYSSLDVLQSIRFDLIKFDMSFMRKLDEGDGRKVILTELMKMVTSLGMDTVCEGVETESQVHFLQEIGCSKLQGFYYSSPIAFEDILEMFKTGALIENENPRESDYYESVGRVNLFDLGVLASGEESAFQNVFDTLPIAIIEIKDGVGKYVRSNRSWRSFVKRFFGSDVYIDHFAFDDSGNGYGATFISVVRQCCDNANRAFFDEKMPDGSIVHAFAQRISTNPIQGSAAVAVAVLSISVFDAQMMRREEEKKLRQEKASLGRIAALSPNYIVLYTVDPVTGNYTQYNPSNEYEYFGLAKQGEDFFKDVILDSPKAIAPEDLERHLRVLTRESMLSEIQKNGFLIHNYRMLLDGNRVPVSLRATLIQEDDGEKIILGITNDEEEYRRKLENAYKTASSKATIYTHIAHALARGYTDLYYVNMDTDEFIEFHTDDDSGVLAEARRGTDFFDRCKREVKLYVRPEDQAAFVRVVNREFLSEALAREKVYELPYRRIKGESSFYVRMRASRMEDDPRFIVIAVSDIDELMRQRRMEERIQEERVVYARLHAITGNFICIYVIDPETGHYREFSATPDYEESFAQAKGGADFFTTLRDAAKVYSHPADRDRVLSLLTQANVMAEIDRSGIFTLGYRIMMDGKPLHVQMKAAMVEEKEGSRLVVGLNDIDAQVRQEEEYGRRLAQAQTQANIDALTGVKNKHAYLVAEA